MLTIALFLHIASADPGVLVFPAVDEAGVLVDDIDDVVVRDGVLAAGANDAGQTEQARALLQGFANKGVRCTSGQVNCFTNAGLLLDAKRILVLTRSNAGNSTVLRVALIDVDATKLLRERSEILQGDSAERARRIHNAVVFAVRGTWNPATLTLHSDVPLRTWVDGAEQQRAPWPQPLPGIAAGEHRVAVADINSDASAEQLIYLQEGEALMVHVTPPTRPATEGPDAVVVAGVATGVIAAVAGGGLLAVAASQQATYDDVTASTADRRAALARGPALLVASAVSAGVAVVGFAVAGVAAAVE